MAETHQALPPTDGDDARRMRAEIETARSRVRNLERALDTNRGIGIAIGILMAREGLTQDDAWERLAAISQARQRKVRDVADEIVYTGQVPPAHP
jgi:AmiR/NasT family two-component response regulator